MGNKNKDNTTHVEPALRQGDEQRQTHRHTLALDTEVHFREQYVKGMFRCRTRNIGLGGVFLPSESMPIDRKTDIELVFNARSDSSQQQYSINAKVVRNTADGAALAFCLDDEKQIQDFRHFLLKAKVASRH